MIAAFLAAAAALIITAWLAISEGRAYVAAQDRLDRLVQWPRVLSELSSTTRASAAQPHAWGDDASAAERAASVDALTKRVAAMREQVVAERAAAREHLESVERTTALLGALTIAFFCFAYAALLRGQREARRMRERFGSVANHDPLTGLPNRRFFGEWLAYALAHARRENTHVGVLFIDIDGCTAVEDLHGRDAAQALLVEIARRFRAITREGDLFARLGATEFALATPNAADGRQLGLLAQRLRDQLNDTAQPPLADTPIGASIGIAFFPEDADDSAGVMAAANAAMYAARRAGRNHVAFNALAA